MFGFVMESFELVPIEGLSFLDTFETLSLTAAHTKTGS